MREQVLPQAQESIERAITKKSRFGQFEIDSRAVRTVFTNS